MTRSTLFVFDGIKIGNMNYLLCRLFCSGINNANYVRETSGEYLAIDSEWNVLFTQLRLLKMFLQIWHVLMTSSLCLAIYNYDIYEKCKKQKQKRFL